MNLTLRLHHYAWVTKDREANCKFVEDVLGMPLVATWCERAYNAEVGGAIGFFRFAEPEHYARHPKQARFGHIALKVDPRRRDDAHAELKRWLAGDGTPNNADHKSTFA